MKGTSYTYCRFPTTLVMVDDNEDFLQSFRLSLIGKDPVQLFTNPHKALDYIKSSYRPYSSSKYKRSGFQDIRELHKTVYNSKRYETVSVVVVDYSMPEMDGLNFCRELISHPVKKILLTGEATDSIAVSAFNEGIIDHFVRKDTEPLDLSLNFAIARWREEYFSDLSKDVLSYLFEIPKVIALPERRQIWADTCNKIQFKGLSERYLLDDNGSELMIDVDKTPHWLIIRTEEQIETLYETAKETALPNNVIRQIKNKTHAPIFLTKEDDYISVDEWRPYIYPIEPVTCWPGYYYTVLTGNKFSNQLVPKQLHSPHQFYREMTRTLSENRVVEGKL